MGNPTLHNVPTPAMVIDLPAVKRNIQRLIAYTRQHGINLRPHTKTHKSVRIARLQIEAGAAGLTAAKVGEAIVMASVHDDLLIGYPASDPARTSHIAELAKTHTVRVAIDSTFCAEALANAARSVDATVGILVDMDIGMHRTGVQSPESALALAQHVNSLAGVRLDGLFVYPGHVKGPASTRGRILTELNVKVQAAIDLFAQHGLDTRIVSGGSSPTAYQSHLMPAVTEIRPGMNVYNDRNLWEGGHCDLEDCAARVICTVVSDAVPDKCVIDAGSKTLTQDPLGSDPQDDGRGLIVEHPDAKITRLTEEHGEVDLSRCESRPKIGDRVAVVPNHICPCVNLQDKVWFKEDDDALEPVAVDARGKLS